jgi:integrase
MPLTDTSIRAVKPGEKSVKLFDGGGLYLELTPSGGKWWRLKYRFEGKEKRISLGTYPTVGLKEARERREQAKKILSQGVDPSAERKEAKAVAAAEVREQTATFESVAREWFAKKTAHLTPDYRKQLLSRLENHLFPYIGGKPLSTLEPSDVLAAVRHTENRGAIETAHRLIQLAGKVCRYGRLVGYCKYDVTAGLTDALPSIPQTRHFAAIVDPEEIGHLLRAIDGYQGDVSISYALRLLPYVFLRSREIRGAEWKEFDLAAAEWIVPATRHEHGGGMKMKRPHVVPLARQVVDLFMNLRDYTGSGRLVFPSPFSAGRCISDMGLLNALRRLGYVRGEMTIHGFRSMASTILNEQGYRFDVIETQLAHGEKNAIRGAYNRAEYLPERRAMMQEWADYLDGLREAKD